MKKSNSLFWIGYSDLLTSLFFVMLLLFGISFAIYKQKNAALEASVEQLKQIKKVELALQSLDKQYYIFDKINKRYKLNIDVKLPPMKHEIRYLNSTIKKQLKNAGIELYDKIKGLIEANKAIEYLLIVEGNAQRYQDKYGKWNYIEIPDIGYNLSYKRALALVNFWKNECNIPFDDISDNCELLIVGSGYFGQSREENEIYNRRFTIQITSKVGKLINTEVHQ